MIRSKREREREREREERGRETFDVLYKVALAFISSAREYTF